ncbi:FAD-dependent oxidoreductase [Candidatus Desantisbacteria bacterium]|nr:FAD-dependent oxidoreductase [Candidatus Desantisbacteria bacterium]
MSKNKIVIKGNINGIRISSQELEQQIQDEIKKGAREITVYADGQHGIGGRIWPHNEKIKIIIEGSPGQRIGSMGMEGTEIIVNGSLSDDAGWINCGAKITVLGDVSNGAHNAGAQGILYVQGGGGARCDTMTKRNPRFPALESWYLRDVGDSFAEFKAGGTAVICGINPRNPDNILGARPCVGMVGGEIYFRGKIEGYSEKDVKLVELSPQDWEWLLLNMKLYLEAIARTAYYSELTTSKEDWKKLIALTPDERTKSKIKKSSIKDFHNNVWDKEVGQGGIFGDLIEGDRSILPIITTGQNRRFKPVWNNEKYLPPCAYNCPSGIPSHKRMQLIRQGKLKEAMELVLQYTPFPGSVCGYVCPNICMENCTRASIDRPLDISAMGRCSLETEVPKILPDTNYKIAVIGSGPGGMSCAWQLRLKGHKVDLYESQDKIGGKIEFCIPRDRLPQKVFKTELDRFKKTGVNIYVKSKIDEKKFKEIKETHDIVVIACGAHKPRLLKFPGSEHIIPAIDFLKNVNSGSAPDLKGKKIVIIGAGNVGMDAACQAYACGALSVIAVDIQPPASFGKEQTMAKKLGTQIIYPKTAESYDNKNKKINFTDGTSLTADAVFISIGETPILDFIPREIHAEKGWIKVDAIYRTSDLNVFAIGDAVKPGLITDAIGQGIKAAGAIHKILSKPDLGLDDIIEKKEKLIPIANLHTEYYSPCRENEFDPGKEALRCASCGLCRDCKLCEETCYFQAIRRIEEPDGNIKFIVDDNKCIGCGFCAGICPCGIWEMESN